ncbi:MAG: LemA family protein [Clostridia bacterium]|nr:LemA family protein [Clostridia bacterium]
MGVGIIITIFIVLVIVKYNKIKTLHNKVKQSRSSIDVYLTQRFDLIPNLVECVKGYAKHEKELFVQITELRAAYNQSKDLKKGAELNNKFNDILLLEENYPDLKANENFLNLQKNLSKMESQLQAARRLYNSDVTIYNTDIETFPGNLFSTIFNFKKEELFEIEEMKKVNIKVDL